MLFYFLLLDCGFLSWALWDVGPSQAYKKRPNQRNWALIIWNNKFKLTVLLGFFCNSSSNSIDSPLPAPLGCTWAMSYRFPIINPFVNPRSLWDASYEFSRRSGRSVMSSVIAHAEPLKGFLSVCVRARVCLIQSYNEWKSITKDWAALYWRIADERRGRRNYETLEMTLLFFSSVSSLFRSSHSHVMSTIQNAHKERLCDFLMFFFFFFYINWNV